MLNRRRSARQLLSAVLRSRYRRSSKTCLEAIPIACKSNNTQAIAAINNGYSKKLRCLGRTHQVFIGTLHEIANNPKLKMTVEYVKSAEHKGDFFTKELAVTSFREARARIGMRSPRGGDT